MFNLLPAFQTNTWLIWDDIGKEALLIDPAAPESSLVDFVKKRGLKIQEIGRASCRERV